MTQRTNVYDQSTCDYSNHKVRCTRVAPIFDSSMLSSTPLQSYIVNNNTYFIQNAEGVSLSLMFRTVAFSELSILLSHHDE